MNAITKAISEAKFRIPMEILNLTFTNNSHFTNESLDEMMLSAVVRPRILIDCNLVGGELIFVPLSKAEFRYNGPDGFVVHFPKSLTKNRSIVSAMSVSSSQHMYPSNMNDMYYNNEVMSAGVTMVQNVSNHTLIHSSSLEMMGDNVVYVHQQLPNANDLTMRVRIENDGELMSNINPRSYPAFSHLVVLGIKAYIYNKLVIMLDKGYLHTGHELGRVKDIIDEYQSADEEYREYLNNTWTKIAFMNDGELFDGFVSSMFWNNF